MFCKRPKAFDTVNMILRPRELFSMTDGMMFSETFQGAITAKGVHEIHRPLLGITCDALLSRRLTSLDRCVFDWRESESHVWFPEILFLFIGHPSHLQPSSLNPHNELGCGFVYSLRATQVAYVFFLYVGRHSVSLWGEWMECLGVRRLLFRATELRCSVNSVRWKRPCTFPPFAEGTVLYCIAEILNLLLSWHIFNFFINMFLRFSLQGDAVKFFFIGLVHHTLPLSVK